MSWRLFGNVREAERPRFRFFLLLGGLVAIAQMLGQAGSEAIFLSRLGAARLPATFVMASLATVAASLLYALRVGRARNDRVLAELLAIAALAVVGCAWFVHAGSEPALVALYCLFFATQAVLTNHYWTLVGDFFDTLAAKRLVPLFMVGLSLGGAFGGVTAMAVVSSISAEALLVGWALGLAAAAALVVASRAKFQRWHALAAGEEDETSVAGIRAAMRYLRASPLGRGLIASSLAMVLAVFVAQYLYSGMIAAAFPDEAKLAAFLALYLAVSNGVEVLVELVLTPVAIRRLGVPTANLLHPLLTAASFASLALAPSLTTAIAARVNRELLDNALAIPVRTLVGNALPQRFRSRVRAFLEGIVVYSGMSLAGAVLLAAGTLPADALAWAGGGLALLYLVANLVVRRQYVAAIVAELRAGRLDLRELQSEIGAHELESLAALWTHLARTERGEPNAALLELPPLLVAQGLLEPVREGAGHAQPRLRAACIEALANADADPALWSRAIADRDASVRRVAVRAVPEAVACEPAVAAALRAKLDDPDAAVRAAAASRLGVEGEPVLAALLAAGDVASVTAALEVLPPRFADAAAAHLDAPAAPVRTAALYALARRADARAADLVPLMARLRDPDALVRRAAVAALAPRTEREALDALATALRDASREVRSAAIDALTAHGDRGYVAAKAMLDAPEESAVGAALRVLGAVRTEASRGRLRVEYATRVLETIAAFQCARMLGSAGAAVPRFAAVASGDAFARALRITWRALARLEDESVVRSAERALRQGSGRARADALEVVSQLGDREASRKLVLLLEPIPVDEKIAALRADLAPPNDLDEAQQRARLLSSPWTRIPSEAPTPQEETLVERLLSLRQVSLFSHMSLERLHAIERITQETEYVRGEVIMREGEPGDELMCLVEGEVDVLRGAGTPDEQHLNRLGPGAYVGDMAVLDGAPRSATVVALTPVRVLVLGGDRLRELVQDMPELAFDLMRVLVERVRKAEARSA
jgi:ATP/ADP translocase/HEAT repeat protein